MSGGSKEGMAPYPKATTVLLKTLLEEAMRRQISSSLTSSPCRHLFLMQTQHKPLPKQLKFAEKEHFKAEELNPFFEMKPPHNMSIFGGRL